MNRTQWIEGQHFIVRPGFFTGSAFQIFTCTMQRGPDGRWHADILNNVTQESTRAAGAFAQPEQAIAWLKIKAQYLFDAWQIAKNA